MSTTRCDRCGESLAGTFSEFVVTYAERLAPKENPGEMFLCEACSALFLRFIYKGPVTLRSRYSIPPYGYPRAPAPKPSEEP